MHAPKLAQVSPQPRARAFATVAMHFAHPSAIIVTRPFAPPCAVTPVPHGGVGRQQLSLDAGVATPLIRGDHRRACRNRPLDHPPTGLPVGLRFDEEAHRPALPRHQRKDGWAVGGVSPVSFPLISAPPRRVLGVWVRGAFFPPRSGITHPPQRPLPPAPRAVAARRGCAARAGVR